MRLKKLDHSLLIAGALLMSVSFYQLLNNNRSDNPEGKTLGSLALTESVVKMRNLFGLDWQDAYRGLSVYENQLIFTNSGSRAEILFEEGSKVHISESTLVRIKSFGENRGLAMEKGIIRTRMEQGTPLVVSMNGEDFTLTGAGTDIQITMDEQKSEIDVVSGELTVEKKGFKELLNKQVALIIEGEKIFKQSIYFETVYPLRNHRFFISNETGPINFSWLPSEQGKILISRHPELREPLIVYGQGAVNVDLGQGKYYWRVEGSKGMSIVSSFEVLEEKSPEIIRPLNGEMVTLLEEVDRKEKILLQWNGSSHESYKVEWSGENSGEKVVQGNAFVVELDRAGDFKWRVKIHDENRPDSLWTQWQEVQVNLIPLPKTPIKLEPSFLELQTFENKPEEIELSWLSSNPVEWEIVYPDGKTEKENITLGKKKVLVHTEGIYKWRVREVNIQLRASAWSDWKTLKVDQATVDSKEGIQTIQLKRPDQKVEFTWNSEEKSKNVFELSRDEKFNEIISRQEIEGQSASVIVPDIGTYYWRSRIKREDGSVVMGRPRRVVIEPIPAPEKPKPLPDLEIPIEWNTKNKDKSTGIWLWEFIISTAHAEEFKGQIKVKLPVNDEAKGYVVRVFKDKDLKELILEREVIGDEFKWEDASPGTYYWQYAIIDHWNRRSPFSSSSVVKVVEGILPEAKKPKLIYPIRAQEVAADKLSFKWTPSETNSNFELQIARDKKFEKIIYKKNSKESSHSLSDTLLKEGLFYWRVIASSKWGTTAQSNSGRFVISSSSPPRFEVPKPVEEKKIWPKTINSRFSISWAPSLDSYSFNKGTFKGEVSGTALNSLEGKGTIFLDGSVINAEVLKQDGSVFDGKDYSFQRLVLDWSSDFKRNDNRLTLGFSAGYTTGVTFDFADNNVTSSQVSSLNYGPVVRSYHNLDSLWKIQTRLWYLFGEVPQLDLSSEVLRGIGKENYFLLGLGYSHRKYQVNDGKQSSLKLTLGIGREL